MHSFSYCELIEKNLDEGDATRMFQIEKIELIVALEDSQS
jgi:hypothetical protein